MKTSGRFAPAIATQLAVALFLLAGGCSRPPEPDASDRVVYTSMPVFGFVVGAIAGDVFEVRSLLASGQSPHSYEPRPSDVRDAARSLVLVYGAPNLDGWLIEHQEEPRISLMDLLADSLKLPPGSPDPNPHFWMDPVAIREVARPLARSFCHLEPDGCPSFSRNAELFRTALDSLHQELLHLFSDAGRPRIVVSHPFLDYFSRRYGIEAINITDGAGGLEPTPRDLSRLIRSVSSGGYTAVVSERGEPSPAARTVAEATGVRLITVDPLGGSAGTTSYNQVILACARAIMPTAER